MNQRLKGHVNGLAYGEATATEIPFLPSGEGVKYLDNVYDNSFNFARDTIETTAKGDYPFKQYASGFIDFTVSLNMRNEVVVETGIPAADVGFVRDHAISGKPFRIAMLDNRYSATPNGFILSVVAESLDWTGNYSDAQDLAYSFKPNPTGIKPQQIKQGVASDIEFYELVTGGEEVIAALLDGTYKGKSSASSTSEISTSYDA